MVKIHVWSVVTVSYRTQAWLEHVDLLDNETMSDVIYGVIYGDSTTYEGLEKPLCILFLIVTVTM